MRNSVSREEQPDVTSLASKMHSDGNEKEMYNDGGGHMEKR